MTVEHAAGGARVLRLACMAIGPIPEDAALRARAFHSSMKASRVTRALFGQTGTMARHKDDRNDS